MPARADGGDLVSVSGDDLVMQRIIRLLFMRPGELLHRPDLGAGLREYQGRPVLPQDEREMAGRVRALLDSLEYVEAFSFQIGRPPDRRANATLLTIKVRTTSGTESVRQITI